MRNLIIAPVLEPGEQVHATAEGNPPPDYVWHKLTGGGPAFISGNTLTVTESMEGSNSYRCEATNTLINRAVIRNNKIINFSVTSKICINSLL